MSAIILIVEDELAIPNMVSFALRKSGYEAAGVEDEAGT